MASCTRLRTEHIREQSEGDRGDEEPSLAGPDALAAVLDEVVAEVTR
jgi:hypothetical protein